MIAWELLDIGGTDVDVHLTFFVVLFVVCMATIACVEAFQERTIRQVVYGVQPQRPEEDGE